MYGDSHHTSQNFAFRICKICIRGADIVFYFLSIIQKGALFLLILIYGGENLRSIRSFTSFTIQFWLVPEVNFCFFFLKKNQKFRGIFASSVETTCIWGGRDKEHGPKLFLLKPILKSF